MVDGIAKLEDEEVVVDVAMQWLSVIVAEPWASALSCDVDIGIFDCNGIAIIFIIASIKGVPLIGAVFVQFEDDDIIVTAVWMQRLVWM